MQPGVVPIAEIESEADFILFSVAEGLVSEHCTEAEARLAFYKEAARKRLGELLPIIYERKEENWVALN